MVLRGDCTCSSVKSNCIFFWKGIIAQCELEEALALPALGGQIKSKMIHQLDSSGPVSVAATAAAVSTGWQLTISAGHTWLLCSVVTTHQAWKIRLNNQTCVICASVFAKRHTFNASEMKSDALFVFGLLFFSISLFDLLSNTYILYLNIRFIDSVYTLKHRTPQDSERSQHSDHRSKLQTHQCFRHVITILSHTLKRLQIAWPLRMPLQSGITILSSRMTLQILMSAYVHLVLLWPSNSFFFLLFVWLKFTGSVL